MIKIKELFVVIIGCLIDGFKSFKKSTYINLVKDNDELYTAILGKNGVGKSAILESLNYLLNFKGEKVKWNMNKSRKNYNDSYIVGLFACNKNDYTDYVNNTQKNSEKILKISKKIDDLIRNLKVTPMINEGVKNLIKSISPQKYKNYYFGLAGRDHLGNFAISPLKNFIFDKLELNEQDILNDYFQSIIDYHDYIYIPAEDLPSSLLTLTGINLQKVLPKKLYDEMNHIFLSKNGHQDSVLESINIQLGVFLTSINSNLKFNNSSYQFSTTTRKKNLQLNDFVDQLIKSFFSPRKLFKIDPAKNQIPIEDLSSGEQKQAIINVFCTLLENREAGRKYNDSVIFSIDEPEISQDYTNVFPQFIRLENIAKKFSFQVLLTTHWYGLLPVSYGGTLVLVKENAENSSHEFYDLYSSHDSELTQMRLKSIYDLTTSIISFLRAYPQKRIILCEGVTDRLYLETYLNTQKVKIIPVGGKDNVKLIAQLLILDMNSLSNMSTDHTFSPQVVCIIDTDDYISNNDQQSDIIIGKNEKVKLCRWQISVSNTEEILTLVDIQKKGIPYTKTQIEDILDPQTFWSALKKSISNPQSLKDVSINKEYPLSRIFNSTPNTSMLKIIGQSGQETIEYIKKYINDHKVEISKMYASDCESSQKPTQESPLLKAIEKAFGCSKLQRTIISDKDNRTIFVAQTTPIYKIEQKSNTSYILKKGSYIKTIRNSLNRHLTELRSLHNDSLRKEDGSFKVIKDIVLNDMDLYNIVMFAEGRRIQRNSVNTLVIHQSNEMDIW